MTREPYPCRQPLEGYDARRGQNSDDYFAWLDDMRRDPWWFTAFLWHLELDMACKGVMRDFYADELAAWNA